MRNRQIGILVGILMLLTVAGVRAPAAEPDRDKPAKTYEFNMSGKPWKAVLEWLADEMDLPFVSAVQPAGTLHFIAPRNKKRFTMPEIIDILNQGLAPQKYLLIRRPTSFTIVAADEKIDPNLVPLVRSKDLARYAPSEIVRVQIQLHSLVADDLKPEIRQLIGLFGDVMVLTPPNQIIVQDTVKSVRAICKAIEEMETKANANRGELAYKCKYIKARDAVTQLKKLLGDPIRESQAQRQVTPSQTEDSRFAQPAPETPAPQVRLHYLSADERTNTVYVTGPADKVDQARRLLEKMDTPRQGQPRVVCGPMPVLKTYKVSGGNAEALAKTLQTAFATSETLTITAISKDAIAVFACPQDHLDIKRQIEGQRPEETRTEVLPLNTLKANATTKILKGMFLDSRTNNPFLDADDTRNAIVVKGTRDQIADVKAALKALGEGGRVLAANFHIFTLDNGGAVVLAETLQFILPRMLPNAVQVITLGADGSKIESDVGPTRSDTRTAREPFFLAQAPRDRRLIDPREEKDQGKKQGKPAPVTITAFGNRLIVRSDDPQALALVEELIRLLTQTPGGAGDFEYIKLKNANAVETAKVVNEAFNGPTQQTVQPLGPFGGGRFGPMAVPAPAAAPNRVQVVPDPQNNSLLVRASPLDLLTVRRLLEKIDVGDAPSAAVIRTWPPLRLKNASAYDVAATIEKVYRERINDTPRGGPRDLGTFVLSQMANQDKKIVLSVGVDGRSNSVIISCPEPMYKEVEKLVLKLDEYAKEDRKTIHVTRVPGVDPALLQQALDAIQRRPALRPSFGGTGIGIGQPPVSDFNNGGQRGGRGSRGGRGGPP